MTFFPKRLSFFLLTLFIHSNASAEQLNLILWCEGWSTIGKWEQKIIIVEDKISSLPKDFTLKKNKFSIWFEEYISPDDNYEFRLDRRSGELKWVIKEPGYKLEIKGKCEKYQNKF